MAIDVRFGLGSTVQRIVSFEFGTPSPMVLQAVQGGQFVTRAIIQIQVAFDGVGASLLFGTTASTGLVLGSGDVNAGVVDQYAVEGLTEVLSDDYLILTIDTSGSTQGSGLILYELTR